jgi:outer membrane usher protein FimD/PapC
VEPDPATLSVSLVVPTEALRPRQQDISGYQAGGVAGLLNYDLTGFYNRFGDDASRFGSANTEVGFNAGDWIVRSRQVQTWQDGLSRSTHLEAYAQRTFAQHQAVLQAGQISLYNPILSGAQINGVQVFTEQALQDQAQGATIEGIANSPAQVEVRQNGALIHSTVVPAGPFALTDVRRLNTFGRRGDDQGKCRRRTALYRAGGHARPGAAGGGLLAGRRPRAQHRQRPRRRSVGGQCRLERRGASATVLGGAIMTASEYRAGGASLTWLPGLDSRLQLASQLADAQARDNARGMQTDLSWSQRLSDQWSSLANTWRSPGYRELEDAIYDIQPERPRSSRYRDQQSATLGFSTHGQGVQRRGVALEQL